MSCVCLKTSDDRIKYVVLQYNMEKRNAPISHSPLSIPHFVAINRVQVLNFCSLLGSLEIGCFSIHFPPFIYIQCMFIYMYDVYVLIQANTKVLRPWEKNHRKKKKNTIYCEREKMHQYFKKACRSIRAMTYRQNMIYYLVSPLPLAKTLFHNIFYHIF